MNAGVRRTHVVALAMLLALGAWPHLFALTLWPTARDDVLWLVRSDPTSAGWVDWVFRENHFSVGYRPVTALSYAASASVGGYAAALPYRLTDLGLHLACAVGVALLGWRAAPRTPAWGPLVGAAIFLAHPLTSQVVPHLARRGYSLCTVLALAGLWVGCPIGADRPRFRVLRGVSCAALLGAGALANEAAYLAFPVAALLAVGRLPRGRRALAVALGPMGMVLVALVAIRFAVIPGGVGGYRTAAEERGAAIALAHWSALAGATSSRTDLPEPPPVVALVALVGVLAVAGRALATLRSTDPEERLPAVLVAWLAGLTAVYALVGVWFPRQAYPALAPWALLLGLGLAETARGATTPIGRAARLAPQLALLAVMLAPSPVLLGTDPAKVAAWRRTDAVTRDAHAALSALPRRATVFLALPYYLRPSLDALRAREPAAGRAPFGTNQAALWLGALLPARIELAALAVEDPTVDLPPLAVRRVPRGVELALRPEQEVYLTDPSATERVTPEGRRVRLEVPEGAREAYVYVHDGRSGALIDLARP